MNRFQVVGVNDDRDFCECCGRTGLKRVVWTNDTETGEVKHFGTSCAVQPVKGFNVDKEVKQAVKRADDRIKMLNTLTHYAYKKAGGTYIANGDSWTPADSELRNKLRAEIDAKGFNY